MKMCLACGTEPTPTTRHTYCEPCGKRVQREAAADKAKRRLKGCIRCGGENAGRGSRFCAPCREAMRPAWQRAEAERSRRKNDEAKAERAQAGRSRRQVIVGETKWCGRCESYRPFSDFGTMRNRSHGMATYCLPCANDYGHERRLETVYGITRDEYDAMLVAQEGRCAICRNKPRSRRLAVDHNHKTGAVRGLLCTRCNQKLLGSANENPEMLRRAADYLDAGGSITPDDVLGVWVSELEEAKANDLATVGFVAVRPKGKPDPEDWYAVLTLPDLMHLMAQAGWMPETGEVAA